MLDGKSGYVSLVHILGIPPDSVQYLVTRCSVIYMSDRPRARMNREQNGVNDLHTRAYATGNENTL